MAADDSDDDDGLNPDARGPDVDPEVYLQQQARRPAPALPRPGPATTRPAPPLPRAAPLPPQKFAARPPALPPSP